MNHPFRAGLFAIALSAAAADTVEEIPAVRNPAGVEKVVIRQFASEASLGVRAPRTFGRESEASMPSDFAPWWIRGQNSAIGDNSGMPITIEDLYIRALRNSKQIRVFGDLPVIRETGIQEAKGAFDTKAFLKGKFEHENDPVGNVLTTGGPDRFKQDEWSFEAGLDKKFITGAEVTLSEKMGRLENNSIYFLPNPQSTATLSLSIVQPLLKGAGVSYNRSTMRIAKLDSQVAMDEFVRQSESHLLEITRTYWALYAARVTYLQKAMLVDETGRLTDELRARQKVDAHPTQLYRAESALASRRSDLVRAEAAVRNAQDRLKALTSDATLLVPAGVELIPRDRLVLAPTPVDAGEAAAYALQNRPEINQAFFQLRAATIREKVERNELLPELNIVLEGSIGGLTGGDYADAFGRQYTTGGPSASAGFVFSYPLENNIARARLERRRLELRQQVDQLKTTIDTVFLEVKISAREVATAYRETQAKYAAVKAYTADVESIKARRSLQTASPPPGSEEASLTAIYLDNLLDSQDRRGEAEEEFIRAAADYQIAIVNLQRAKGKLLAYSNVTVMRGRDENGLPLIYLQKNAIDGKSTIEGK